MVWPVAAGALPAPDEVSFGPLVLRDLFNEASNTLIENHTPDVGNDWSIVRPAGAAFSHHCIGGAGILERVNKGSGYYAWHRFTPEVSGDRSNIEYTVTTEASGNTIMSCYFRMVDADDHELGCYMTSHDVDYLRLFRWNGPGDASLLMDRTDLGLGNGRTCNVRIEVDEQEVRFVNPDDDSLQSAAANTTAYPGRTQIATGSYFAYFNWAEFRVYDPLAGSAPPAYYTDTPPQANVDYDYYVEGVNLGGPGLPSPSATGRAL